MGIRDRKPRMKARLQAHAAAAAERADACAIVAQWNGEVRAHELPLWSPSIRCALLAGHPYLEIYCPGCGTARSIDLRRLDRHAEAGIASLVLGLSCSWCRGRAPMPRLLGLYEQPYVIERKDTL